MKHSPVRYNVSPMVDYLDQTMQFLAPYGKPGAAALEIPDSLLSFYAAKLVLDGSVQQERAISDAAVPRTRRAEARANYPEAKLRELVDEDSKPRAGRSRFIATATLRWTWRSTPSRRRTARLRRRPASIASSTCRTARPDQIARMKKLGVQPSFLISNVYYYGKAYREQIFGPDRTARAFPVGDFYASGIPFSLHSDCPCSPVQPLRQIGIAVARQCLIDGSIVAPEERVPIDAALKGMTSVAAAHCGMGDKLGSLETGKYADLTILEDDPRKVDPAKLGDINVSQTWVDGRKVEIPAG